MLIGVVDDAAVALDRPTDDLLGTSAERLEDLRVDVLGGTDRTGVQDRHRPAAPVSCRGLRDDNRGRWHLGSRIDRRRRSRNRFDVTPRRKRRLLVEDRELEVPELLARVETELVVQIPASLLVGLERLGLAAVGVERKHEQPPQRLPPGLVGDETTEFGDRLTASADVDARLVQLLDSLQPELFQTIGLASRESLVGDVTEGGAGPLGERGFEGGPRAVLLAGGARLASLPKAALETCDVELVVGDCQAVARRGGTQAAGLRAEDIAQPRDVDLDRLYGAQWLVVRP